MCVGCLFVYLYKYVFYLSILTLCMDNTDMVAFHEKEKEVAKIEYESLKSRNNCLKAQVKHSTWRIYFIIQRYTSDEKCTSHFAGNQNEED